MPLAGPQGGVVHRAQLRRLGVAKDDVRTEVRAGRWTLAGRHTVLIGQRPWDQQAWWWRAVWESGSGAALDGVAALKVLGLTGWDERHIDVSVPRSNRAHPVSGVRLHRPRQVEVAAAVNLSETARLPGATATAQLLVGHPPRVHGAVAALHAAQWAVTDRAGATVLCLPLQQRLLSPAALLTTWQERRAHFRGDPRRNAFIGQVVLDLCDGARSLGELDFARMCRAAGLPAPTRQVLRCFPNGRVYLDVAWEGYRLVVEIDGSHHGEPMNRVSDALRQNDVVLGNERVLRIPVLGLRLEEQRFMAQVRQGLSLI